MMISFSNVQYMTFANNFIDNCQLQLYWRKRSSADCSETLSRVSEDFAIEFQV